MDPSALISPVTDALGTLGSGLFDSGADPTAMLQGISQAFQSTGSSLKPALSSVEDAWKGVSGTTAATKTAAAVANGAEVGAQSDALKGSLATAATDVAQARVRLIEIIAEFQATMAAIGPNIIFPWGWAAAIAAANKAVAMTTETMTELQTSLAAQSAQVTTAGAPVAITAAPQLAASSPVSSLMSPLMSMATQGAQAGIQAGTGAASAASQAAQQASADANPAADAGGPPIAVGAGGGGVGGGGSGVGGAGMSAPRSMATSTMVQPETASAVQTAAMRGSSGAMGASGAGMMGGGGYGPMAGQGANNSSNSHTPAAFLHTTDQGGEIVGDLGTAAPPVLGEADPNEAPDVRLRI